MNNMVTAVFAFLGLQLYAKIYDLRKFCAKLVWRWKSPLTVATIEAEQTEDDDLLGTVNTLTTNTTMQKVVQTSIPSLHKKKSSVQEIGIVNGSLMKSHHPPSTYPIKMDSSNRLEIADDNGAVESDKVLFLTTPSSPFLGDGNYAERCSGRPSPFLTPQLLRKPTLEAPPSSNLPKSSRLYQVAIDKGPPTPLHDFPSYLYAVVYPDITAVEQIQTTKHIPKTHSGNVFREAGISPNFKKEDLVPKKYALSDFKKVDGNWNKENLFRRARVGDDIGLGFFLDFDRDE